MTLCELLRLRAEKTPRRLCLKFEDRKFSYAELDRSVTLSAGGLKKEGLQKNDRVAILMDNCPEFIILYFAILRAGGVVIPVNTFLTPGEISFILNDSGCRILLYSENFLSHIEKIKNDSKDVRLVLFDQLPQQEAELDKFDENDIAVFLYTSGTTGFPKGAMLTHKNLLSNAKACMEAMSVTYKDKVLLFLPLFHAFSFTVCVILPICAGASIVLLASVKPFSKVIKSILRDRITLFVAIPTIYNILSKKHLTFIAKLLMRFLIRIRLCVSGAASLPETTLYEFEKRFNIPLAEGYGLTEASPVVSVNPLKGVRKPGSVGLPIPGVEVSVIGEDSTKLPNGEIGELIVKGPNIMKGYFNKEEETQAVLRNGWLYTGDMACIDEDGYLFILDRKKDLIIVDGMNIYPKEVEDVVWQHPCVDECSMVGIPDGKGSEITCIFIKKQENTSVDDKEIRNYLSSKVARFKIPKKIRFIEEFPKTATGKIKKGELRKLAY